VKTYSSGMTMRLAFAVQVLTDPEILVIDEALSVGDFFFQQKCFRYIRELCDKGVTLLFVSHDMGTVRNLCQRAIYLRSGEMVFAGDTHAATQLYFAEAPSSFSAESEIATGPGSLARSAGLPSAAFWQRPAGDPRPLLALELLGGDGLPVDHVRMGGRLRARVYFRTDEKQAGHISIVFKNRYDQVVSTLGSLGAGLGPLTSGDAPFAAFQLDIDMMLEAGLYSVMVAFSRPTGANKGERVDDTGWIGPFRVDWDYERETAPFLGMCGLPVRAQLIGGEE